MNVFIEFSTADIEAHRCLRLPLPRLVCRARRLSGARLLSEVLRYLFILYLYTKYNNHSQPGYFSPPPGGGEDPQFWTHTPLIYYMLIPPVRGRVTICTHTHLELEHSCIKFYVHSHALVTVSLLTRNSAIADKPHDTFMQMHWHGWTKTRPSPCVSVTMPNLVVLH